MSETKKAREWWLGCFRDGAGYCYETREVADAMTRGSDVVHVREVLPGECDLAEVLGEAAPCVLFVWGDSSATLCRGNEEQEEAYRAFNSSYELVTHIRTAASAIRDAVRRVTREEARKALDLLKNAALSAIAYESQLATLRRFVEQEGKP